MTNTTRWRRAVLSAAPFPALTFFGIWASAERGPGTMLVAALVLLAYGALVIFLARRWDEPSYFQWGALVYFAVVSACLAFRPGPASRIVARYAETGIYLCLFSVAFFPPLMGMEPFTYYYARKSAPRGAWGNPVFVTINRIMARVWAGLFGACALVTLCASTPVRVVLPGVLIAGFGLPFTLLYPDRHLKRLGLPTLAEQRRQGENRPAERPQASPSRGPESAREVIARMPAAFIPGAAGDLKAVIGFVVSGRESFAAYLVIEDGACTLKGEPPRTPDLLIHTPSDVWLAIARGERDGQRAFAEGAYETTGNLGILLRMKQLFGNG